MFDSLSDRLDKAFGRVRGKGRLSEDDVRATTQEVYRALLEADVALPVARGLRDRVRETCSGAELNRALNPAQQVVRSVGAELTAALGGETRQLRLAKTPPTVVLLVGLQGSGKTTFAGKLGHLLKGRGHVPLLVACDLQRPNAVDQLRVGAQKAGVEVFAPEPGNGVGDPVDVARRGVEHARAAGHDVVVVDTAGRLGVDAELMAQAADVRRVTEPDEVLFVVDSMTGQDAATTARAFADGVGLTGVVLTKLDGDARGGAALSVREVTGVPVMFASTGEALGDVDVFHPQRMASRILGMGDVLTLIERAEQQVEAADAEETARKLAEGGDAFSLEDFLTQLEMVSKMGPLKQVLGMLPGMGGQMKEALEQVDDSDLGRIRAIILSMTPGERQRPKTLDASRRRRVAAGSGTSVPEVNQLLERFEMAKKQIGGLMGSLGLGGRKGGAAKKKQQSKGKGARKSGNPAKAAAQAREAAAAAAAGGGAGAGGGPQLPAGLDGLSPELLEQLQQGLPGGPPGR